MHNCAIICEYNPFHTGHEYQINRVRECGASSVFCVMSGNFVQSAMPSFCDKSIRAKCAISGGAGAVIELPTMFATASAGHFAEGAIKIISAIRGITHIAMGATSPADTIQRLAEIRIKRKSEYDALVMSALKSGKSYNFACAQAYCAVYDAVYGGDVSQAVREPNNILCIEYIATIDRMCANIQPYIVMREGARHNSGDLDRFASATAIRKAFDDGDTDSVKRYIPYGYSDISNFRAHHAPDIDAYKKAAIFALKCADEHAVSELRDCTDGMEHAVKKVRATGYDDLTAAPELKKFGKKKIARLLLDCLLGIKKSALSRPFITRLLACKKDFDFSDLPDFVKTTNAEIKKAVELDGEVLQSHDVDRRAASLYGTLCGTADEYYNYSLVKA